MGKFHQIPRQIHNNITPDSEIFRISVLVAVSAYLQFLISLQATSNQGNKTPGPMGNGVVGHRNLLAIFARGDRAGPHNLRPLRPPHPRELVCRRQHCF